jgi:ATP-dependent RNA helicase DHX29
LDPVVTERILELALSCETSEGRRFYSFVGIHALMLPPIVRRRVEEVEEKAIARLGITYGILRRLCFTEERVDECLRSIGGIDLDEALDWVGSFVLMLSRLLTIFATALSPLH